MLSALIRDHFDPSDVVPECYAAYRPMVRDAVGFFVSHLSPSRSTDALAAQAALPGDATSGDRLLVLMHQCPALHKFGQVLARHPHLDATFRVQLQTLESCEPATPLSEVDPVIREHFAQSIDMYRIELGAAPIAEASVAVVVPFTWIDPGDPDQARQDGVFKVLRPGVERRLTEDLLIMSALADHLDATVSSHGWPALPYRRILDDVAALLRNEIDPRIEQQHLAVARRMAARQPGVMIPKLCPFQSPCITAMQRLHGTSIDGVDDGRAAIANLVVRALLADAIFNNDDITLFHADPHAGNLFITDDGQLAVLDWSLTGWLTRHDRELLLQLSIAVAGGDRHGVTQSLCELTTDSDSLISLTDIVDEHFNLMGADPPHWPGLADVIRLVDAAVRAGVAFPARFLMLRKAVFTIEGVVADLCPEFTIDHWLTAATFKHALIDDAARRFLLPAGSRQMLSGLSTMDLFRMTSGWITECLRRFALTALSCGAPPMPQTTAPL